MLDDLEFDREQRRELLTIINEECDRINRLVGEAAEIARLESGEVKLDLALHSVGELLSAALAECKSVTANREICLDVKHQDSRLLVDLSLAKRVLVHLITKADLYSSPGKPIRIATQVRGGFHTISVADQGPGIDNGEIDHIFEKFYRGKSSGPASTAPVWVCRLRRRSSKPTGEPSVSSAVWDKGPFLPSVCQRHSDQIFSDGLAVFMFRLGSPRTSSVMILAALLAALLAARPARSLPAGLDPLPPNRDTLQCGAV